jgi:hypothetical protein
MRPFFFFRCFFVHCNKQSEGGQSHASRVLDLCLVFSALLELISDAIMFFSHNKSVSAGLSATETIKRKVYQIKAFIH